MELQEATSVGLFVVLLTGSYVPLMMSGVSLFWRAWSSSIYHLVIDVLYQHKQKSVLN